jgi:3-oxoacyl-[acyl-carrier-protein] synthase III
MSAGARITAVGMAVPERIVSNAEIATRLGVEQAWIVKRTGTHERHWAVDGELLTDFASVAGRHGLTGGDLDLVIVGTSSADAICPNAAPVVAGLLGAERAGALDVGAACTGWLTGLSMACGQIEAGRARHALVIGADMLSRSLDPSDRDTSTLFGDGAGAAVVSATTEDGIGPIILHTDPSGAELIRLDRGGQIQLRGPETFRGAVAALSQVTLEALDATEFGLADIDLFVYHQANSRIIRAVGERLALDPERVVDYMARFANTSSATLPMALTVAEQEGRLTRGDRVLLAAFGGGFTFGATVLRWGPS